MRIAVLTSSRADYGIYRPLLLRLKNDAAYHLELVAFGSHLQTHLGRTISEIQADEYPIIQEVNHAFSGDRSSDISLNYASCAAAFASFWASNSDYDFIFALGDRFEMAAAVNALIPYRKKLVHFYAGDTTLGAIDNIYRHQITLASAIQFVSVAPYKKRVKELLNSDANCCVIGNLSLLNLENVELLSKEAFLAKWGIDLAKPTILCTVHPETVDLDRNESYARELERAMMELIHSFQFIISPPNADTGGKVFRDLANRMQQDFPEKVKVIENLGTQSYFTCMNECALMLGNTSSGIVEAASFGIFVLNLGDRQKGRISNENVIHLPFQHTEIVKNAKTFANQKYSGTNCYAPENAIEQIKELLESQKL